MSIFSGLFRSRDKPKNRTAGSAYTFYTGRTTAGKAVTQRSAMQMTAVYSCVRILSEAIASLPLHLYKYTESGGKEKATDSPLYFLLHDEPNPLTIDFLLIGASSELTMYFLLHDEPNPEMTSFVFRETLMTHLLLWGNAYAQIIRNGKGEVTAFYPLMPDRMTVDRDENGRLYYEYIVSSDDAPINKKSIVRLQPFDVLHIPGLGFDGLVGYSPAAPSGVLEHPGTIKDPSRVRESWTQSFGGSANAHKVAVLEEGMKYTPISISPEQAQFLETRKFQINEIARIFRVPPHMVGDLEKSSFSNIEQQSLEFVKYTLEPWIIRWEQSISRSLLSIEEKRKYFVKFNVDGLLRGDYQSRMDGYATARQNGWMSANDIRELENLDVSSHSNYRCWKWTNLTESNPTERILTLNGTIAEESWFDDDITPQLFKSELNSCSGNITVWINSPGGDCVAAAQIYNMLMDYKGNVTVKIDGIAASAASVIAMAGNNVMMSPVSMLMIHNPATVAMGDHNEMQKAIEMLEEVKESIINAYEIKTGMSRAKLARLMEEETWMNAKKAVELGFADSIIEPDKKINEDEKEKNKASDSILFSRRAVSVALQNKLKSHYLANAGANTGTDITGLEKRLNLLKP